MIDDPLPADWRELQSGVCRLLNEVGLTASTEAPMVTPRGSVTVDVFAVDENSVDKIKYIVECKNWATAIPQSVVHSFTTVMHETGANIGFIVSKHGLQTGARQYTENTNILGLTYLDLQQRYFPIWWEKYFCIVLGDAGDVLLQYVEPINSYRDRIANAELDATQFEYFRGLIKQYAVLGMFTAFQNIGKYINLKTTTLDRPTMVRPISVVELIETYRSMFGEDYTSEATTLREFLYEIVERLNAITQEFHDIFGRNIFETT